VTTYIELQLDFLNSVCIIELKSKNKTKRNRKKPTTLIPAPTQALVNQQELRQVFQVLFWLPAFSENMHHSIRNTNCSST